VKAASHVKQYLEHKKTSFLFWMKACPFALAMLSANYKKYLQTSIYIASLK